MADVQSNELLVLAEQKPDNSGRYKKDGWKLRVVTWFGVTKGGKPWESTKLEKRKFFLDDDDAVKLGKAEGFTLEDMKIIQARWKEIIAMLANPPQVEQAQTQATTPPAQDSDPEMLQY